MALLDRWLAGEPAEAALTRWARASRFAGSGDREAVRDLVYDAIRQRRSAAALGGAPDDGRPVTGRALILGCLRAAGQPLPDWTDQRHAPDPLSPAEAARLAAPPPDMPRAAGLDIPDWLLPHFDQALGARADEVLSLMRTRAPVCLRANAARITAPALAARLADEGVQAGPHPLAPMALHVTAGARRLRATRAFADGLFELQDAASQAVAERVAAAILSDLPAGARVLDFCAGGGGKALALAARGLSVTAHDADPRRMRDLPVRAARAGADIALTPDPAAGAPWPAILADVPCSGSGSWRRAPEAKWTLTPDALAGLTAQQDAILKRAAALLAPGGVLGYATCSLLRAENEDRITALSAALPGWACIDQMRLDPLDGGDGFFLALLRKPA